MTRTSRVTKIGWLVQTSMDTASMIHFGDNGTTRLKSRAIAVQRAVTRFDRDETRFAAYSLFSRAPLELDTGTEVAFEKRDCAPSISIGWVRNLGLSAASLLRAGESGPFVAETYLLQIRQFNDFQDMR